MPDTASLIAFAAIALGMVLTPGPNMVYLVSRSISQGRMAGLISLGGVALGFVFYMLCAAFGITALVMAVPYAYDTLRFAGALYLLYLAWQALRPGGLLILEAFHPDQLPLSSGGPKDVAMLYTLAMLRADFADMTELLAEETDAVLDEGSGHQGPAKVTRWIGQR